MFLIYFREKVSCICIFHFWNNRDKLGAIIHSDPLVMKLKRKTYTVNTRNANPKSKTNTNWFHRQRIVLLWDVKSKLLPRETASKGRLHKNLRNYTYKYTRSIRLLQKVIGRQLGSYKYLHIAQFVLVSLT